MSVWFHIFAILSAAIQVAPKTPSAIALLSKGSSNLNLSVLSILKLGGGNQLGV
jgi:hypothetical protein